MKPDATSVLVTTSRMPFTLDEIRKFGRMGHRVYAADTYSSAPGSHSKYVAAHIETPSPRYDTEGFIGALEHVLHTLNIEWLIPGFEDAFFIARNAERLAAHARVFAPPFDVLQRLHNKMTFVSLAQDAGLETPPTLIARSQEDLRHATEELGDFFARPVYSRAGTTLFTNRGPLAGDRTLEDCKPNAQNPWLVQGFVEGTDICTFSVAHEGRMTAHSTYVHPFTLRHAGGISFESVDMPDVVDAVARLVEATRYTGQVSLDFMRTPQGLVAIECNPRPTSGVTLLEDEAFVTAVFDPKAPLRVAPPGIRRHFTMGLIIELLSHWDQLGRTFDEIRSDAKDIYAERSDLLPELYMFISHGHLLMRRAHPGQSRDRLLGAFFDDVVWDGEDLGRLGDRPTSLHEVPPYRISQPAIAGSSD